MTKKKRNIIIISVALAVLLVAGAILGVFIYRIELDRRDSEGRSRWFREYYDAKIALYEEENAENPNPDVVFLGDSLTDGCDLSVYYPEYNALNRGIGGDTSFWLLDRLKVSAYDVSPKAVVLLIGGNDILRGKSLDSVYSNYEKIISGLKENLPQTKIIWCSLTVLGNEWARHNETCTEANLKIIEMAEENGCVFIDLYNALIDNETQEIKAEYTIEGVHLTDEGYNVVSALVKTQIAIALEN